MTQSGLMRTPPQWLCPCNWTRTWWTDGKVTMWNVEIQDRFPWTFFIPFLLPRARPLYIFNGPVVCGPTSGQTAVFTCQGHSPLGQWLAPTSLVWPTTLWFTGISCGASCPHGNSTVTQKTIWCSCWGQSLRIDSSMTECLKQKYPQRKKNTLSGVWLLW